MKIIESFSRIILATGVLIVWLAMFIFPIHNALATGPAPTGGSASAGASANVSGSANSQGSISTHAYGSGSPSANACQGIFLFAFSYPVETCQLQQWAAILGDKPTPMQLQIACSDRLLAEQPFCEKYRKP